MTDEDLGQRVHDESMAVFQQLGRVESLTPDELLIARQVWCNKMIFSTEARLGRPYQRLLVAKDPIVNQVLEGMHSLRLIAKQDDILMDSYATRLGISRERVIEIRDLVYAYCSK